MSYIQILTDTDKSLIRSYELEQLKLQISDEMEREMASWNAPWRDESLALYLSTGWSVGLWSNADKEKFLGYFLAQPLLFFCGLTQVLWVETLSASNSQDKTFLIDTAIRYSREKHLQSVFFNLPNDTKDLLLSFKGIQRGDGLFEVKTTKR